MKIIQIFSGLLTPVIACIAVYIAYQQQKTARNKLRLDLYDRRYNIYQVVKMYISNIVSKPNNILDELAVINSAVNESKFLFNEDIHKYLESIVRTTIDYQIISSDMASDKMLEIVDPNKKEVRSDHLKSLIKEFTNFENKFLPYLNFRNIQK